MIDTPPRFTSGHEYVTLEAYYNTSYYARTLPPVPKNCPTPLGTVGPKTLPDVDLLVENFFVRKKFIPEPHGSNILFASYAQHFTHQFFKTNFNQGPGFTWGSEGVDLSHVYGQDVSVQMKLRSFQDGKLKSQIIDGEEFPVYLNETPGVPANYPPTIPDHMKFALGHPFYGLLPGLFVYSTIWLREHNRVCDILRVEHPSWDDERLFQTARLILVGETIKITVEEYVQHLSQYNFKLSFEPTLTHGTTFQYSNRIRAEFAALYHWHPLYPDYHNISGNIYPLKNVMFRTDTVFKHGFTNFLDAMVQQRAGKLSHHNHGQLLVPIIKAVISHSRQLRFQSFNNYRIRFGLRPYRTMKELTGEDVMSAELEKLYGSVDGVEFVVGLFVEKDGYMVTPMTMVEIGGPYSVKGLMANPICSPSYWKPSTFGGEIGMNIIQTATLQKLFCLNLKKGDSCPRISFSVPPKVMEEDSRSHEEL
ncbi:Prostaglandin G/H synthase 2, variant 2 [Chamberlinius hualienensis]